MFTYSHKKNIFAFRFHNCKMAFFGYISSLVVAVMLAVFYIGNITQYVIHYFNNKPGEVAYEIKFDNTFHATNTPHYIVDLPNDFEGFSSQNTDTPCQLPDTIECLHLIHISVLKIPDVYDVCVLNNCYGSDIVSRPPPAC